MSDRRGNRVRPSKLTTIFRMSTRSFATEANVFYINGSNALPVALQADTQITFV